MVIKLEEKNSPLSTRHTNEAILYDTPQGEGDFTEYQAKAIRNT